MKKLTLMSVLIATFALPMIIASRNVDPRRVPRILQKRFLTFCVIYVIMVLYIAPRLFH